jgi:hypothetical protein
MELTKKAQAVVDAIEECGASEKLTNAVSLASSLREDIEFMERRAVAVKKGWKVPPEDTEWLPKHAWNYYWIGCASYEKDPTAGRPVPPHRSGGGEPINLCGCPYG